MKKNLLLLLAALFVLSATAFAQQQPTQNVLDGVYVKEHHPVRNPMVYPFLREADVLWSKKIWRVIDVNEKINLPLKYPQSEFKIRDRKNLADVLFDAMKEGAVTAYSFIDDEFTLQVTMKEIEEQGGARRDTQRLMQPEPPYMEYDTVIDRPFKRDAIFGYRLKEEWFFEKQRSVLEVRIIGIAPLVYATDEQGNIRESRDVKTLCWFYFDELRPILARQEIFNRQNDAQRLTFEDVFQKRMFNSFIIKEANVYDRKIADYKQNIAQILESNRVKEDIFILEHNMWEY